MTTSVVMLNDDLEILIRTYVNRSLNVFEEDRDLPITRKNVRVMFDGTDKQRWTISTSYVAGEYDVIEAKAARLEDACNELLRMATERQRMKELRLLPKAESQE